MKKLTLRQRVAAAICWAMEKRDVNGKDLARMLGVSQPYISNLRKGGENVTLGQMERVFGALGFQVMLLVTGQKKWKRSSGARNRTEKAGLMRPS